MTLLFGNDFIDDILLKKSTGKLLESVHGKLSKEFLHHVCKQFGIDTATVMLYQWITEYKHRDFCNYLANLRCEVVQPDSDVGMLIIPGMFYKEFPEMGGNGNIIKSIAEQFGFEAEIVPTQSTGDLLANAMTILDHIKSSERKPQWLVSISKGSAEVGICLNLLDTHLRKNIRGWISLCGIFNGSPMADIRLKNPLAKIVLRSYLKWKGANYQAIEEMRPSHLLWKQDLLAFDGPTIHIQPIPVASYVHARLIKRYRQLAEFGPNDGTIMLDDIIDRRGQIYPLWGVDHFFRDRDVIPLIYKLCQHIKSHEKQRTSTDEYTTQIHSTKPAVPVFTD